MEAPTVVQLLCDLSEASDELSRIDDGGGKSRRLGIPDEVGSAYSGTTARRCNLHACDADHSEVIEYDGERQRYVHFCPDAGFVSVADADLITHEFHPEWLVDWLIRTLPISSPHKRGPGLVPRQVWHLGDAKVGGTVITVVFARRVSTHRNIDLLASALRPIYRADKGLVVTTSLNVARQVALPGGYELLPLPEMVSAGPDGLSLEPCGLGRGSGGCRPPRQRAPRQGSDARRPRSVSRKFTTCAAAEATSG